MTKPSEEIAQRYVDRLTAQGIGDLDHASHETCMLARWSALMNWLDEQHEAARVERQLSVPPRALGLGVEKLLGDLTAAMRPESSEPDALGSVDQNPPPVESAAADPARANAEPDAQGSAGGGVAVEAKAEATGG